MTEKRKGTGKKKTSQENEDLVTFVDATADDRMSRVRDAQNSNEELVLDEELEEDVVENLISSEMDIEASSEKELADEFQTADLIDMHQLAEAIRVESEKHVEELQTVNAEDEDAKSKLAEQIAEDEALERQLAEQEDTEEGDPELLAALPKEPQVDEEGNLDLREMESCIETLLFMSEKPLSAAKLQELLGPDFPMDYFEQALTSMQERFSSSAHGIELAQVAGGWQFRTKPGRAALAKKLAKVQQQRLSSGAMETLAIVAYKQPVLKDEIDKIRGVDSSHFIRGLMDKKLVKISGRSELPGRPMLYSTSQEFLELFGLNDLAALPSLRELEQMVPASQSKNPEDDDPRVKEMRRLVNQMKTDSSTTLKYDPREDEKILKEIRERVSSIPSSTPYLDAQKEQEKLEKLAAQGLGPLAAAATQDTVSESASSSGAASEETEALPAEGAGSAGPSGSDEAQEPGAPARPSAESSAENPYGK